MQQGHHLIQILIAIPFRQPPKRTLKLSQTEQILSKRDLLQRARIIILQQLLFQIDRLEYKGHFDSFSKPVLLVLPESCGIFDFELAIGQHPDGAAVIAVDMGHPLDPLDPNKVARPEGMGLQSLDNARVAPGNVLDRALLALAPIIVHLMHAEIRQHCPDQPCSQPHNHCDFGVGVADGRQRESREVVALHCEQDLVARRLVRAVLFLELEGGPLQGFAQRLQARPVRAALLGQQVLLQPLPAGKDGQLAQLAQRQQAGHLAGQPPQPHHIHPHALQLLLCTDP